MTKQNNQWEKERVCVRCEQNKPIGEFNKNISLLSGRERACKVCKRVDDARRYYRSREKRLKKGKEYDQRQYVKDRKRIYSKERYRAEPIKAKARMIVNNMITLGKLLRKSCTVCGEVKSEAHHEDYNKPLWIEWLCRKHHFIRHRKYNEKDFI